jgi:hypothetical protein
MFFRGQTIGKYPVVRELGKGATGKVYLCDDPFSKRQVAIKVSYPDALKNSEDSAFYRNMFMNEAALAGKLNHPHIVQIFDAVVDIVVGTIATVSTGVPDAPLAACLRTSNESVNGGWKVALACRLAGISPDRQATASDGAGSPTSAAIEKTCGELASQRSRPPLEKSSAKMNGRI